MAQTQRRTQENPLDQLSGRHQDMMRGIENLPDELRRPALDQMIRSYQEMWMRSQSPNEAPRPRPPGQGPVSGPLTDLLNQFEQEWSRIQNLQNPAQREAAMNRLMNRMENLWDDAEARLKALPPQQVQPQIPAQVVPTRQQAPMRTYVYDITMDGRTYRLTLGERLPANPRGTIDSTAARRRLMDALLHNEPVLLGGQLHAEVTMLRSPIPAEADTFNGGPPNAPTSNPRQRMDLFRDRYLEHTHESVPQPDGNVASNFVDDPNITITRPGAQRRPRRRGV